MDRQILKGEQFKKKNRIYLRSTFIVAGTRRPCGYQPHE